MTAQAHEFLDLLAKEATDGIDADERWRLDDLLSQNPTGPRSLERAAAAIALTAPAIGEEPMPAALRARITAQGRALREVSATDSNVRPFPRSEPSGNRSDTLARQGWLLAAASLILAVIGWWPRSNDTLIGPAGSPPTAEQRRAGLVESTTDALELPWTATEDDAAAGASGDVVWSNARQAGFMRFRGLEANDPSTSQYQLWIFDAEQDERYPIDGGVFDVSPDGETIVAIDPKIAVREPTLFAVTVEPPGGVVVSSRERIVLVAAIG